MTGLLDSIFNNLEEKNLDRNQIIDYIRYLDEIIAGGLPYEKEIAYQRIKLKLSKRLHELNKEQINFYRKNKEEKGKKEES